MVTTKTYDNLNRLTAIQSSAGATPIASFAYAHNSANQRTSVTNVENARWVYTYDALDQVTSGKKYWSDGTNVAGQQFEYSFDDIGNRNTTATGGDQFGANLRSADYKAIRRGWFFGEKALKEELLAQVGAQAGGWHYGEELRESAEAKAERIVAEELKRRRWEASTLDERRKGDAGKLAIARRLREETTMTLSWIADRLGMGTKTHLAHLFYWERRQKA